MIIDKNGNPLYTTDVCVLSSMSKLPIVKHDGAAASGGVAR
jgi:hypothetical protein